MNIKHPKANPSKRRRIARPIEAVTTTFSTQLCEWIKTQIRMGEDPMPMLVKLRSQGLERADKLLTANREVLAAVVHDQP